MERVEVVHDRRPARRGDAGDGGILRADGAVVARVDGADGVADAFVAGGAGIGKAGDEIAFFELEREGGAIPRAEKAKWLRSLKRPMPEPKNS
jgi:hypothetical protein